MAMSEATEARLPFGMGTVDLTNPGTLVAVAVSLIAGFALFHMSDSIGDYVADRLNQFLGGVLGFNPATGADSGPDLV